jgi:hypothetical protein
VRVGRGKQGRTNGERPGEFGECPDNIDEWHTTRGRSIRSWAVTDEEAAQIAVGREELEDRLEPPG